MTITTDELATLVETHLGPHANKSGSVLGVSLSALAPSRFYMMGFNPGGDPDTHRDWTIRKSVTEVDPGWSAHAYECWQAHPDGDCEHLDQNGRVKERFLKKHQRNVLAAHDMLDAESGLIVATNAIFARSAGERTLLASTGLNAWQWWERCWPVHQRMLAEVRPEWIVALGKGYGTSAFSFLMHEAGAAKGPVTPLGNDDDLDGRMFSGELRLAADDKLAVQILGLPHPSWYGINDALRTAIRAKLGLPPRQGIEVQSFGPVG